MSDSSLATIEIPIHCISTKGIFLDNLKNEYSEILKNKFSKVLEWNGIHDRIMTIQVDENPQLPVHFTSSCSYITIHFCKNSVNSVAPEPIELFVKTLKDNTEIKEEEEYSLYDKESNVYTGVLPELRRFCIERTGSDDMMDMFPKVYYAADREIIMNNLNKQKQKYIMIDRDERHSFHEASMVMRHLARFHAVSYTLIQEIGLETFNQRYPHTRERMMKREGIGYTINTMMIDNTISKLVELIQKSELPNSEFAHEKLYKYEGKAFSTMCDIIEDEQLFHVLNHGDCWTNNILFQQDENENLTQLKFVDLQMTRVGSPSLDIGYYFYNSVKPEVRKNQFKSLLDSYFEEFQYSVAKLHGTVDFSQEEFLRDHGRIAKLGFIYGVYITAAAPLMGKVDLQNSENWIEDFVAAIFEWLDKNPKDRQKVLQEIIEMVQTFCQLGDL